MPVNLRIAESDWARLRSHCASSFRSTTSAETGALGLIGRCQTAAKDEFIVTKVLLPGPSDLKIASSGEVVFTSRTGIVFTPFEPGERDRSPRRSA